MYDEMRKSWQEDAGPGGSIKERTILLLQRVRDEERERCARVAEADYEGETHTAGPCCAPRIARMIREGR